MDTFICLSNELPLELCKMLMNNICITNIKNTLSKLGYDGNDFICDLRGMGCCIVGTFVMNCFLNEQFTSEKITIDIVGKVSLASPKVGSQSQNLIHPFENSLTKNFTFDESTEEITLFEKPLEYLRTYAPYATARWPPGGKNTFKFWCITDESRLIPSIIFFLGDWNIYFDGINVEYRDLSTIINKKINIVSVIKNLLTYFTVGDEPDVDFTLFSASSKQIHEAVGELLYDYAIPIFIFGDYYSAFNDISNKYGLNKYKLCRVLFQSRIIGMFSKYNNKLSIKTKIKCHILFQCIFLYEEPLYTRNNQTTERQLIINYNNYMHSYDYTSIIEFSLHIFSVGRQLAEYRKKGFVIEY